MIIKDGGHIHGVLEGLVAPHPVADHSLIPRQSHPINDDDKLKSLTVTKD